jgi:ATP-dependent helicase HepA
MKRIATEHSLWVGQKVWVKQGRQQLLAEVHQPPRRDQVKVLSFNGPGRSEKFTVPLEQLAPATLVSGQRVYIPPGDYWRHGRIIVELTRPGMSRLRIYMIAFPDGQKAPLVEDQFHVHNDSTYPNPFDALIGLATETPFLCEHRSSFVQALVKQRAACAGMTGLLSARIELIPHQIDVVRRVLQDPRQRYFLADEVGLGKTIESGVIIKQLLLDDPGATAVVLAPGHLVPQWQMELTRRFDIEPSTGGRVQVYSHDEIDAVKNVPELLVLDEAHHLVRGDKRRRDKAARLSVKAPRLLLLSATPVIGQERELLTLLSWLEPHLYSPNDEAAFRRRVQERQTIGNELLLLRPGMPAVRLRGLLRRLIELFDKKKGGFDDRQVVEWCEELLKLVDKEKRNQEAIDRKVTELRLHISECYRLHRRLIRHRRRGLTTPLAKRELARHEVELEPDMWQAIWSAFDQWRDHVAFAAREMSEAKRAGYETVFRTLVEAIGCHPRWGAKLVELRLADKAPLDTPEYLTKLMWAAEMAAGEGPLLKELLSQLKKVRPADDRIALLVALFQRDSQKAVRAPKTVIFTQPGEVAGWIAERIRQQLLMRVALVRGGMTSDEMAEQLRQFQSDAASSFLVCDATGSEGLNLQFAERIVHFDLPLDPFAVEQRIGRIDRLTRVGIRVPNIVVSGGLSSPGFDDAWVELLRDGFQLFSQSISDLNLFADRRLPGLISAAFEQGAAAWVESAPVIRTEIEAERQAIDAQDAIDAVDLNPEATEQLYLQLSGYEADLRPFQDAVFGYLRQLNRIDVHKLRKALPHQQVRWHSFDNVLLREDWYKEIHRYLLQQFEFDRAESQRGSDRAFLRLGHPLVDALEHFALRDDRGKAFIVWRPQKGYRGTHLVFRVDYLVEADAAMLGQALESIELPASHRRELARLADTFFPPRVETLYFTEELEIVEDSKKGAQLLSWLRRPYDKRTGDRNIARHRVVVLLEEIGRKRWESACEAVRDRVPELIAESPAHQSACKGGADRAHHYFAQRLDQVRLGNRHLSPKKLNELLAVEETLSEAMEAAIRQPAIRIDAAGAMILSGKPCPVADGED